MKNLENYGVLEMNAKEMKETDGGWLFFALFALVAIIFATDGNDNTVTTVNGQRSWSIIKFKQLA